MCIYTNCPISRNKIKTMINIYCLYVPTDGAWNGQFIQSPGDAMLVMYQMPADAIIKGLNVPVYEWGTGEQQMTISLHTSLQYLHQQLHR